jgi:hypothetical protein
VSKTLNLTCPACQKTLWVGQYSASLGAFYTYGTEKEKHAFDSFVNQHLGHTLMFQDSDSVDIDFDDVTDYVDESGRA